LGAYPSRAIAGDWSLAKGKSETFRHQITVRSGALDDVALTDAWKAYSGEASDGVRWGLAKADGRKAVAKMSVPAGFEVILAAAEAKITPPMAFCWDHRGRLVVAENRDYETRGKGFANNGDSRIVILADTDGLWLGAPPNLLFAPDKNHDDVANDKIEAVATALSRATRPAARLALLEGQRHGLTSLGRREVDPPANRDTTVTTLSSANDAKVRELLTQIGQLFGDAKASAAQLALLQDRAAPLAQRREILLAFARDAYAAALPTTLAPLDEEPLRRDAIRALAAFDHNRVALSLLAR
jgi:hypothetical protein